MLNPVIGPNIVSEWFLSFYVMFGVGPNVVGNLIAIKGQYVEIKSAYPANNN